MGKIGSSNPMENRERIARMVAALAPTIRRRIRGKFHWRAFRDGRDADDVFSSAWRRIDEMAATGRIRDLKESELERLLNAICRRIVIDSLRAERRQRRLRERLAVSCCPNDLNRPDGLPDLIAGYLNRLKPTERVMVDLWLRGCLHSQIAQQTGRSIAAYRSCWLRLMSKMPRQPSFQPLKLHTAIYRKTA